MEIDIVSVPFNSTGRAGGTAAAPAALHAQGLVGRVREALPAGWRPSEPAPVAAGERSLTRNLESGLLNEGALVAMIDGVADVVATSHATGRLPLLLGGDGPVLLGGLVAAGHRPEGPTGLLAFCGRECAWPPSTSRTGEAADCTIGLALVAHTNAALSGGLSRRLPLLAPQAVALLGPRDAAELAAAGIPSLAGSIIVHSDEELTAAGSPFRAGAGATEQVPHRPVAASVVGRHATEAIEHIRQATASWWLHVDLDVLSTEALPAVAHRRPGGLSWDQLTALTRSALAAPGLIGWSVTSYDADLDLERTSAARIVDYLLASVGALPASLARPPARPPATEERQLTAEERPPAAEERPAVAPEARPAPEPQAVPSP
jgi:arginase